MNKFLKLNWYKLIIAFSLLIFSIGFLIFSVSPAYSKSINVSKALDGFVFTYVGTSDGIYKLTHDGKGNVFYTEKISLK